MTKKIIIIVVALIVLGALAWYFKQNILSPKKETSQTEKNLPLYKPKEESPENINNKFVFVAKDKNTDIEISDISGKDKKIVFTDTDRDKKIKKISNLAETSGEVIIFSKTQETNLDGSLELVKLDGSGQTEQVAEKFSFTESIGLSSDGQSISFVNFSNVEADYGYSLYTMNRKAENLRQIVRDDLEITSPAWGPDAKKIAYVQKKASGAEIRVVDLENGNKETLYTSAKNIYFLSWSQNNKIIFGKNLSDDLKSSEIDIVDSNGKNLEKIISDSEEILNFGYLLPDNTLAYLKASYQEKISEDQSGKINIFKIKEQKTDEISTGSQVLGWLP